MSDLIRKMCAAHYDTSVEDIDEFDMHAMRAALAVLADGVTPGMAHAAAGEEFKDRPPASKSAFDTAEWQRILAAAIREAGK